MPTDPPPTTTECCGVAIAADQRFCPKCGYEARIVATDPPPTADTLTRWAPDIAIAGAVWMERSGIGPYVVFADVQRLLAAERQQAWYLLYGGHSEDGQGPGVYEGRTSDPALAREHFQRIANETYSTGYVLIVTDATVRRAMRLSDFKEPHAD